MRVVIEHRARTLSIPITQLAVPVLPVKTPRHPSRVVGSFPVPNAPPAVLVHPKILLLLLRPSINQRLLRPVALVVPTRYHPVLFRQLPLARFPEEPVEPSRVHNLCRISSIKQPQVLVLSLVRRSVVENIPVLAPGDFGHLLVLFVVAVGLLHLRRAKRGAFFFEARAKRGIKRIEWVSLV